MLLEELLKTERNEGKEEGKMEAKVESILAFLDDLGSVSVVLKDKIERETDMDKLDLWLKEAARAESIDQFIEKIQ